jgi:hypothetical protein
VAPQRIDHIAVAMGETGGQSFQWPVAQRAKLIAHNLGLQKDLEAADWLASPLLFESAFCMKAELLDDFRKLEFGYI